MVRTRTWIVAGAVLLTAACGGDKNEEAEAEAEAAATSTTAVTAPPTTAPPPPPPAPEPRRHTVERGDTLFLLAQKFGTTVDAIAQANGITDVNAIQIGQELQIPPAP